MKIVRAARDLETGGRKVCLAIGTFDGVHLGHQQVIRQTVEDARQHEALSVVITFDRHPRAVVAPDRMPPLIYTLAQKLRAIASLGVEATLLFHFDEAFSRQPGEQFLRALAQEPGHLHSICVGSDFTFGYQRSGNVDLLRKLGQELGFQVQSLAALSLNGQPVSSTRVRDAIRAGQFDVASQMLGRSYGLEGPVVRGDQLGHRLGFPTANLEVTGLVVPPNGIYAAHARFQGRSHRAVVNIGYRPTVAAASPGLRVEAHLLDFQGDLYGQDLELIFVEKLRDEQKFSSLEDLKRQIARDIVSARERFV